MNAEVRRARKRPVDVEFMVWPGGATGATPVINWILEGGRTARYHGNDDAHYEHLQIDTLEGTMHASPGDVVIRGVAGEFYPCKPDIFWETYDILTEED